MTLSLGIDFGTSGARAVAIDRQGVICHSAKSSYEIADIDTWQPALFDLIAQIPSQLRRQISAIAIDGTSSTVLFCDSNGKSIEPPILYNDARAAAVIDKVRDIAPPNHLVTGATSSFAKLVWQCDRGFDDPLNLMHQADWLAFLLHGKLGISDYNNALKLGYDAEKLCYPDWLTNWLEAHQVPIKLPNVLAPGEAIATVTPAIAAQFSLNPDCRVCAGTTDSTAAFLASVGAGVGDRNLQPGMAVTSLGSTLVIKILSRDRVENAKYGVYSHKLGDLWLVGGASNTGGAVLRQFFSDAELKEFSDRISPDLPSPLDYYPLIKQGERFPINDPNMQPRLQPRPGDHIQFLHGLLESIARIEAKGYQLLQELGASPVSWIYSTGGGAQNQIWQQIRARYLPVPMLQALQSEAAYGAALLSLRRNQDLNRY